MRKKEIEIALLGRKRFLMRAHVPGSLMTIGGIKFNEIFVTHTVGIKREGALPLG